MNADMNHSVDYLAILNAPTYHKYEEPRYVNVPCREISDPEDDVELKPMLKKPGEIIIIYSFTITRYLLPAVKYRRSIVKSLEIDIPITKPRRL